MFHRFRRRGRRPSAECPGCAKETANTGCRVLAQLGKGCCCRVRGHKANGAVRQRLLDLGFVPDAEVEMIRCATLGDPLEMRLGDYYVTLRKREAEMIEVKDGDCTAEHKPKLKS
ncbi:MAG TPA: ferrous iron transport protein A [Desulfobacteraceae bacterium]|nr:ferrous iron transport protein A [Desulfobacteraceae bacterium]